MRKDRVEIVAMREPIRVTRELARLLDRSISELKEIRDEDCMRNISPAVRKALKSGETSELEEYAGDILIHAAPLISKAQETDGTWGEFWDGLAWNGFASLASAILTENEKDKFACLSHVAYCIIAIEQGKENPDKLHFNVRRDELCTPGVGWGLNKPIAQELHDRVTKLLSSLGCRVT